VVARHNDRRGPTGALRRPLDFRDSDSRASLFMAIESKTAMGPVVQRMVTMTWLPSALRPNGLADPVLKDYLAVTDVPPVLSSTANWSPIPQSEEIGREEALFRRADHRLPA
jgi:hypothetical protein